MVSAQHGRGRPHRRHRLGASPDRFVAGIRRGPAAILPEGTLTKTARVSFNQDGERPGWVLVGAAPDVAPLEGTGIFAARLGSVRVAGWANTSEMPNFMSLNEIYIITIHP